jgi:hypothetical protein
MAGRILGVFTSQQHICKLPIKLFKPNNTVWLCDCDKLYILRWQKLGPDSDRVWTNISLDEFKKLGGK